MTINDLIADSNFRADVASGTMSVRSLATKYSAGYGTAQSARASVKAELDAASVSVSVSDSTVAEVITEDVTEDESDGSQVTEQSALPIVASAGQGLGLTQTQDSQEALNVQSALLPVVPPALDLETQICVNLTLKKPGDSSQADISSFEVDADKDRLKATKKIFVSDVFKRIQSLDVTIRHFLREKGVGAGDYLKSGMFMIAPELVSEVDEQVQEFFGDRQVLVEEFMAEYPSLIVQSGVDLRVLFNEGDYLSAEAMRAKFFADVNYFSFKKADALQSINSAIWKREEAKAADRAAKLTADIEAALLQGANDTLTKLVTSLTPGADGKMKVIKSSTLDNWKEFFDTLKARNITGNASLNAVADAAAAALMNVDVAALKTGAVSKESLLDTFNQIKGMVDASVTIKPKRAVKFDDADPDPVAVTVAGSPDTDSGEDSTEGADEDAETISDTE